MMTFSISRDLGAFEWAGTPNPLSLFCQPRNLFRPEMWRMIWDVLRFNACAVEVLQPHAEDASLSIGDYLKKHGYSDAFRDDYLVVCWASLGWLVADESCSR